MKSNLITAPTNDRSRRIRLSADQISSNLGEEIVILNLKTGIYHGVEGVGAFIWRLLDGPAGLSESEICAAVVEAYDVSPEQCAKDVDALLEELLAQGLILTTDATAA